MINFVAVEDSGSVSIFELKTGIYGGWWFDFAVWITCNLKNRGEFVPGFRQQQIANFIVSSRRINDNSVGPPICRWFDGKIVFRVFSFFFNWQQVVSLPILLLAYTTQNKDTIHVLLLWCFLIILMLDYKKKKHVTVAHETQFFSLRLFFYFLRQQLSSLVQDGPNWTY